MVERRSTGDGAAISAQRPGIGWFGVKPEARMEVPGWCGGNPARSEVSDVPRQEHQLGRFLSIFEERLARRAYLRTHGEPSR
jgi:hypothetical protein